MSTRNEIKKRIDEIERTHKVQRDIARERHHLATPPSRLFVIVCDIAMPDEMVFWFMPNDSSERIASNKGETFDQFYERVEALSHA